MLGAVTVVTQMLGAVTVVTQMLGAVTVATQMLGAVTTLAAVVHPKKLTRAGPDTRYQRGRGNWKQLVAIINVSTRLYSIHSNYPVVNDCELDNLETTLVDS
jgi:hypothetical protein